MIFLAAGLFMETCRCLKQRQYIVKMSGNVLDWLSYAGVALIKVADSTG